MSAMGSDVIVKTSRVSLRLPTRLDHAGNFAGESEVPETDPAKVKLAEKPARPPAAHAAVAVTASELRLSFVLGDFCGSCHRFPFLFYCCRNGIPMCRNSARPSASVLAVVVMLMFIPFTFSTLL